MALDNSTETAHPTGWCQRSRSLSPETGSIYRRYSGLTQSQACGYTDPLSCSTFTPELFRMYPQPDVIKDYITLDDMEDIIEYYTGQALVKAELSNAELEAQGVKTRQEFVVQRAYTSYFEIYSSQVAIRQHSASPVVAYGNTTLPTCI